MIAAVAEESLAVLVMLVLVEYLAVQWASCPLLAIHQAYSLVGQAWLMLQTVWELQEAVWVTM